MKNSLSALLISILITACLFAQPDKLTMLTPTELHQIMQKKDVFLVDVHVPEQHHIKGTDLFVPFHQIKKKLNKFPKDKRTPIYLYCKSGPMGNAAAKTLFESGYKEIYNLQGGKDAWLDAGYGVK
ncbi:MAG: rhodanese-like domain-containing protein [Desulfobacterales bacterium]|uniref:Rhodanese-like domain-containing protein n=1 Tax=Candidatus Desulfatibia vada TaxID=2841696 RepID=A0A8J6TQ34_9BACT|nr:rhodanese-like domain-containing protein [Candidatus Desulfatibia vada]MBL6970940.1 rhodanese-like domain-containing protein [Desulfobacterales bacterium]